MANELRSTDLDVFEEWWHTLHHNAFRVNDFALSLNGDVGLDPESTIAIVVSFITYKKVPEGQNKPILFHA